MHKSVCVCVWGGGVLRVCLATLSFHLSSFCHSETLSSDGHVMATRPTGFDSGFEELCIIAWNPWR